jgi:hypothetical protein
MYVRDVKNRLITKVQRAANQLFVLDVDIAQPVCLLARAEEAAWRWHARLGHLGFQSLRKMASQAWIRGLSKIDQVDQLFDSCLTGKQWQAPFPNKVEHQSSKVLELVHGDICGPITPSTPSGKKMFILLDDTTNIHPGQGPISCIGPRG